MDYKFLFPWYRPGDSAFFKNLDNLRELHNTTIVYFHPEEHSKIIEEPKLLVKIQKILKRNNCTLELWLGNFEDNNKRLELLGIDQTLISVINWPTFLMNFCYEQLEFHQPMSTTNIDRLFLCLNRRPTTHKCVMIDEIFRRNLQELGKISWLKRDGKSNNYNFKYFDNQLLTLDTDYNFDYFNISRSSLYQNCLIDLVVETSVDIKDISEKTWFSIIYKRPPLVFGHVGLHQTLKDMGFELYEELFDYSFDSESDLLTKIQMILDNIENHRTDNYNDVYSQLMPKLNRNVEVLKSIVHDTSTVPDKLFYYINRFQDDFPLFTRYHNIGTMKK